jgi:predicted secreted protein
VEFVGSSAAHSRASIRALWNGTCQISIGFAGNTTYSPIAASSAVAITGMVTPQPGANAAQSISITTPSSAVFGATVAISATSTSSLPVALTTTTPQVCVITQSSNGAYTLTSAAGLTGDNNSCNITATQGGDDRWAPATTTIRSLIFKRPTSTLKSTWSTPFSTNGSALNIVVNNLASLRLDETTTGVTPIVVTSLTPKVCTVISTEYVGGATSHTKAMIKALWNGTCQVTTNYAGSPYLAGNTSNSVVTISGITTPAAGANAAQTIAFNPQSSASFGTTIPLVAKATSNLPVTITTTTPLICALTQSQDGSYSVTNVAGLQGDSNNCVLVANQAGDTSWAPAPTATRTIRFTRMAQNITFTMVASRFYGGAPTVLSATSTSALPVTFSTTTPSVCKVDLVDSQTVLNYVLPLPAASSASCFVVASQAGNGTYSPASSITRAIQFRKESTSILATWSGAITTTGIAVDFVVKSASQPSLNEAVAGTTPLVITSITPTICRVINTAYVGSSTSHTQATVKSMWNGNCILQAAFAGNSYWLSSSATATRGIAGMLQPEPGANVAQTLSISAPSVTEIGAPTPVTISATSKLAPVVKSLTPTICEITPTATSFAVKSVAGVIGNGNICTIEASQPGDDRWLAAKAVTRSITINKAGMSVRLSWLSTTITGTTPAYYRVENRHQNPALNNGLNSIGHISTFVTTTPAICSVSNVSALTAPGGTYTQANVTGIANGTCSITYGFAGDDTRNAAYRTQLITVTGIK